MQIAVVRIGSLWSISVNLFYGRIILVCLEAKIRTWITNVNTFFSGKLGHHTSKLLVQHKGMLLHTASNQDKKKCEFLSLHNAHALSYYSFSVDPCPKKKEQDLNYSCIVLICRSHLLEPILSIVGIVV